MPTLLHFTGTPNTGGNPRLRYPTEGFSVPSSGIFFVEVVLRVNPNITGSGQVLNLINFNDSVNNRSMGLRVVSPTGSGDISFQPTMSTPNFNAFTGWPQSVSFPRDDITTVRVEFDLDTGDIRTFINTVLALNRQIFTPAQMSEMWGTVFTLMETAQNWNNYVDFDFYSININGNPFFVADDSNGSGDIIPDRLGGSDALLLEFPIDGSQWVFYSDTGYTLVSQNYTISAEILNRVNAARSFLSQIRVVQTVDHAVATGFKIDVTQTISQQTAIKQQQQANTATLTGFRVKSAATKNIAANIRSAIFRAFALGTGILNKALLVETISTAFREKINRNTAATAALTQRQVSSFAADSTIRQKQARTASLSTSLTQKVTNQIIAISDLLETVAENITRRTFAIAAALKQKLNTTATASATIRVKAQANNALNMNIRSSIAADYGVNADLRGVISNNFELITLFAQQTTTLRNFILRTSFKNQVISNRAFSTILYPVIESVIPTYIVDISFYQQPIDINIQEKLIYISN
jgi:hypothetical protein